jgi:hypothetical protein
MTLAEKLAAPGFRAKVKRQGAKLDAEMEGWAVLEPKHYRALLSVARAAERYWRAYESTTRPPYQHDAWGVARSLSRLRALGAKGRK